MFKTQQPIPGIVSNGGLRRMGAALLVASTVLAAGCGQPGARAVLTTTTVTPAELAAQRAEDHGETHPNNVGNFLASLDGTRTLQAVAPAGIKPAHSLMVTDLKVVEDPVRSAPGGA